MCMSLMVCNAFSAIAIKCICMKANVRLKASESINEMAMQTDTYTDINFIHFNLTCSNGACVCLCKYACNLISKIPLDAPWGHLVFAQNVFNMDLENMTLMAFGPRTCYCYSVYLNSQVIEIVPQIWSDHIFANINLSINEKAINIIRSTLLSRFGRTSN